MSSFMLYVCCMLYVACPMLSPSCAFSLNWPHRTAKKKKKTKNPTIVLPIFKKNVFGPHKKKFGPSLTDIFLDLLQKKKNTAKKEEKKRLDPHIFFNAKKKILHLQFLFDPVHLEYTILSYSISSLLKTCQEVSTHSIYIYDGKKLKS